MTISLDPSICPTATLPEVLDLARSAEFDSIILHCAETASSPFHPDTSVRLIREYLDDAGITLSLLNVRALDGLDRNGEPSDSYSLRVVEWDIHLARALRQSQVSYQCGPPTNEARKALVDGTHTLSEKIPQVKLSVCNASNSCLESLSDFDTILSELPDSVTVFLETSETSEAVRILDSYCSRIGAVAIGSNDADTIDAMKSNHYSGPIVISLPPDNGSNPAERASAARCHLEESLT